jgi:acyl-CoA synthetase (AMP-forming)/AMP-acid ligase II
MILLDELPRNPVGKVLKRELRAWVASGNLPQTLASNEVTS